ncbi:MAG: transcriptional repressor [Blastocatellia bacterium]|nr:transcriptional repressor [Blastocatellia bacterium]MCS7157151.1 transcriptional repressor [Blastocatellia bacterium]MCX7752386.1 transcriptional repressor [Blastocatellia bacterium]MDW8167269.1 Fur family transcriptional regulator [Acidobacteriota bacterium]
MVEKKETSRAKTTTPSSQERPEKQLFHEYLRRKGLKRTTQRDLILETFLESEKHITSEDLYRKVRERDPSIGFTTVYRTLKLLTECGIARSMQLGDRYTHYELGLNEQHHDHLICLECGGITEFFSQQLETIQAEVVRRHGFQMVDHSLRIWGICRECQRRRAHRRS